MKTETAQIQAEMQALQKNTYFNVGFKLDFAEDYPIEVAVWAPWNATQEELRAKALAQLIFRLENSSTFFVRT